MVTYIPIIIIYKYFTYVYFLKTKKYEILRDKSNKIYRRAITENYKILLKEIKEDLNKLRYTVFMVQKTHYC